MTTNKTPIIQKISSFFDINDATIIPLFSIISQASRFFETSSSLVFAYKQGYQHSNIANELSIILLESIVTIHGKTFVKTTHLTYFNRLKNYNKVWNHETQ